MTISSATTQFFIEQLKVIRNMLNELETHSTRDAIDKFENQLTLDEIETCFSTSTSEELSDNLAILFAKRWERIRNSSVSYTQQPFNKVNQFCLELATVLSPLPPEKKEYGSLPFGVGPYFVLMPGLTAHQTVYGDNIHHFKLHEFVLSDNAELFIPIEDCFEHTVLSDAGEFTHIVSTSNKYLKLSPSELNRLINHSEPIKAYYETVMNFNAKRIHDSNFGAQLTQLVNALRAGSVRQEGDDRNAAAVANQGIVKFAEYWNNFSEEKKKEYYSKYPRLKDAIGRLFRPTDTKYLSLLFCIELIANVIDPIIEQFKANERRLIFLKEKITEQKKIVKTKIQSANFQVLIDHQTVKQPNVIRQIIQLDKLQQKTIFKDNPYQSTLMYELENDPGALPEYIDLVEESEKKNIVTARFQNNDSALILAAKMGALESARTLVNLGADIEAQDLNNSTALYWAAYNGHHKVVRYLVEQQANIEARGDGNNTPLNIAVSVGAKAAVDVLLEFNADINARNRRQDNALDIAIKFRPELIEKLLFKAITLSSEKQASLLKAENGAYDNVLLYAAKKHPEAFPALVEILKKQNNTALIKSILSSRNNLGQTPLVIAATLGSVESIQILMELGASVEEQDKNKNTALHWAAKNGHSEVVTFLLDHKANIEAQDDGNGTALCSALFFRKSTAAKSLLERNANIMTRNSHGDNALDIAIKYCPELIGGLLLKAVTLNPDKQLSFLSNIEDGKYENIFIYAMSEHPRILDSLLNATNMREKFFAAQEELNKFLDIDGFLNTFNTKLKQMVIKEQSNELYEPAVQTVRAFINQLTFAKAEFLFKKDLSSEERKADFKQKSIDATMKARPVLEKYREWAKIIATFLLVLLTFPVSVPLIALGIFSVKTKSAQELDGFEKAVNSLPPL